MEIPSLLRSAEHTALSRVLLRGSVIDLGGDSRSAYRKIIGGNPTYTTVNLDPAASPDIEHDLEQPLMCIDDCFDHAVLINVLEHIDRADALLAEAVRIVRSGGHVVVVVPFLFPYHPSPSDFRRYSAEALRTLFERSGLIVERIEPLGTGVFAARYVMLDRLLPAPIRALRYVLLRPLVLLADRIFCRLARLLGKRYDPADYALGFLAVGIKL